MLLPNSPDPTHNAYSRSPTIPHRREIEEESSGRGSHLTSSPQPTSQWQISDSPKKEIANQSKSSPTLGLDGSPISSTNVLVPVADALVMVCSPYRSHFLPLADFQTGAHQRQEVCMVNPPHPSPTSPLHTTDKEPLTSESCIKGHRTSSCNHTERPLFEIKRKGRPVSQCDKCRELRKTRRVHSKCLCSEVKAEERNKQESASGSGSGPKRKLSLV